MKHNYIIIYAFFLFAAGYLNQVKGQVCPSQIFNGTSTFYFATSIGNCSFPIPDTPAMTVALNPFQYDTAATCGACILVTSVKGSVTLSVEDRCPSCAINNMDISDDAKVFLTNVDTPVNVQWHYTGCPVTGGLKFYFSSGSNPFYTEVQIRNHRYAVKKVEYDNGSQFVELPRADYNYFIASLGLGNGPYTFRVTDVLDDVITESGIPLLTDSNINGTQQFPLCITSSVEEAQENLNALKIYNNPASNGQVILQNDSDAVIVYSITDIIGRLIQTGRVESASNQSVTIQTAGMYLISYPHHLKNITHKIIVN